MSGRFFESMRAVAMQQSNGVFSLKCHCHANLSSTKQFRSLATCCYFYLLFYTFIRLYFTVARYYCNGIHREIDEIE